MKKLLLLLIVSGMILSDSISNKTKDMEKLSGYFNMYWDSSSGKLWLEINDFDKEFLYVNSLTAGIGSNDIGLDRGQLGNERIVFFKRIGPKVLMMQPNYTYRALTTDKKEKQSVAEGFAKSTLWGFEVAAEESGKVLVDATEFFMQDAHGVINRLKSRKMGSYKVDISRSSIYLPGTMNFPKNTNVETMLTYTGNNPGNYVRQVTPTPTAITVRLHHSFIQLPDKNYSTRKHDPRAGFYPLYFQDYSADLDESIYTRYIQRHRLEKVNPSAQISKAKKPIVYYVDPGVPEPIRTAMIESGKWWNDAFSAAGYEDAFQIKMLPDGAHPMDVRYNMIHWVHRATRGWSYGGWVSDPRTGEIIKGNVSLGSLRLRQDYLIATGLLAPYEDESRIPSAMREIALARIKQLVAHEIGHTIGIQHNFLASSLGRASVMDYPHPLIELDDDGNIDLGNAYDDGIGEWDKRVILYGYQDFPGDTDRQAAREQIMADTIDAGLVYVSDPDSRAIGSANPLGNLWDNGADSIEELEHLLRVRAVAMRNFSAANIRPGQPMASLEEVLVPIYLLHRFQLIAVGKHVGGHNWTYALRGDGQEPSSPVSADKQRQAIAALLNTLTPAVLRVPDNVLTLIPPRPPGHPKSRETFPTNTGKVFEPIGAAESAATLTLDVLLEPSRAARMIASSARNTTLPGFDELVNDLLRATWYSTRQAGIDGEIERAVNNLALERLMMLAVNEGADGQARAIALDAINGLDTWLQDRTASESDSAWRAHYGFGRFRIEQMRNDPSSIRQIRPVTVPPGEPIGLTLDWHW